MELTVSAGFELQGGRAGRYPSEPARKLALRAAVAGPKAHAESRACRTLLSEPAGKLAESSGCRLESRGQKRAPGWHCRTGVDVLGGREGKHAF